MVTAHEIDKQKGKKAAEEEGNFKEKCGCNGCPECEAKKNMMAIGYSEEAVDAVFEELNSKYGEKKGLWHNIHQKRKRIKNGSGERMRKPGSKGAPDAQDLKDAAKDDKK